MKYLLILCFVFAVLFFTTEGIQLSSEYVQTKWNEFKNDFNVEYPTETHETYRHKIFMDNLYSINQHNEKYKEGLVTYKMGINQFTDKLHSEYLNEISCNFNLTSLNNDNNQNFIDIPESYEAPLQNDWSALGAVTPVKSQGHCGSCWAFASTGALESAHWRTHHELVSLSEQNLVDCADDFGSHGCHGGFMSEAYEYIKENEGIDTTESYPYTAIQGDCKFKEDSIGAQVASVYRVKKGSEKQMKKVIAAKGPVAVAIDASLDSFRKYHSGVYYDAKCSKKPNHAVLIVGYGTEKGVAYWKVKNSWGPKWGKDGYIYIARNRHNLCSIATFGFLPIAE